MKYSLLLIDDDDKFTRMLKVLLKPFLSSSGLECIAFHDSREALDYINEKHSEIAVIVTDYRMPGMNGIDLIRAVEHPDRDYQILLLSGQLDRVITESALHLNIFDFLQKQTDVPAIVETIEKAWAFFQVRTGTRARLAHLEQGTQTWKDESGNDSSHDGNNDDVPENFKGIVGRGDSHGELVKTIRKVAGSTATCFIQGESGTGKEMVARAVHESSHRKGKPYVIINCGAIPAELFESELFGHKKGAFTGAVADKKGLIEQAREGTLFLDEITEMPPQAQVKLLRFLQEGTIQPVGAGKEIKVDVRVVAASNRNMSEAVKDGTLREDLYFRLNVVPMKLAPLRRRPEDIQLLCRHFLEVFSELEKKDVTRITPVALELLEKYYWPGNIRELRNIIHRTVLFAEADFIDAGDLPYEILSYGDGDAQSSSPSPAVKTPPLGEDKPADTPTPSAGAPMSMKEIEKQSIREALLKADNNKDAAAAALGISRASIYRKIKEYKITTPVTPE